VARQLEAALNSVYTGWQLMASQISAMLRQMREKIHREAQ
jgi:hypothetical protein